MQNEALGMLESWQGKYHTHGIFRLLEANSEGDDIVLFDGSSITRIPMLRQQKASSEGEPNLCLADFIRPLSQQKRDQLGLFCTTVDAEIVELYHQDDYLSMLAQTLCDRLAEASAERLHEQVRKELWGYAPDEHLTMEQSHREEYQGIRPAVGYPSMPDTSVNFILNELLGMKDVNIRLTESGMMSSVYLGLRYQRTSQYLRLLHNSPCCYTLSLPLPVLAWHFFSVGIHRSNL